MTTPINYFFNRRLEQSRFHSALILVALFLMLQGCATDRPSFHIVQGNHEAGRYWDHKEPCKPEAAVKEYTKAIEMALDPKVTASLENYNQNDKNEDLSSAYTERGNIKSQYLNDPKGAIEDYTEAIKYSEGLPDPRYSMESHYWAYEGRAKCKEQLNDHKGALADLEQAKILRARQGAYQQAEYSRDQDRQAKIEAEKQAERQKAEEQARAEARRVEAWRKTPMGKAEAEKEEREHKQELMHRACTNAQLEYAKTHDVKDWWRRELVPECEYQH